MTITLNTMIMIMIILTVITMMTTKTSMMCLTLIVYTMMITTFMSMKMKLTPIPYIVFLTLIGGLMIVFLYLTATIWMKKESLTLKTKLMILMTSIIPIITLKNMPLTETKMSYMNMFNNPYSKITMILIITITLILIFTIEIHMKANMPFRRKLKIWG